MLQEVLADEAVIAIENVRLFTELQARTRQLTHSIEQLSALGAFTCVVASARSPARPLTR